jgi:hypothetical protein
LGKEVTSGHLNTSLERKIVNSDISVSFYLVGDEAFPLKTSSVRPYPKRDLDFEKKKKKN